MHIHPEIRHQWDVEEDTIRCETCGSPDRPRWTFDETARLCLECNEAREADFHSNALWARLEEHSGWLNRPTVSEADDDEWGYHVAALHALAVAMKANAA